MSDNEDGKENAMDDDTKSKWKLKIKLFNGAIKTEIKTEDDPTRSDNEEEGNSATNFADSSWENIELPGSPMSKPWLSELDDENTSKSDNEDEERTLSVLRAGIWDNDGEDQCEETAFIDECGEPTTYVDAQQDMVFVDINNVEDEDEEDDPPVKKKNVTPQNIAENNQITKKNVATKHTGKVRPRGHVIVKSEIAYPPQHDLQGDVIGKSETAYPPQQELQGYENKWSYVEYGNGYSCDQCGYQSEWKSSLLRHIKAKHEEAHDLQGDVIVKSETAYHPQHDLEGDVIVKSETAYPPQQDLQGYENKWSYIELEYGNGYSCDQCGYQSKWKSCLLRHIKAKHEEAQYRCQQCDYKVGTSTALKVHVEAKHMQMTYSCDQCPFKSVRKSSVRQHVKSRHEGVYYPCPHCGHKSKQKGNLMAHIKARHGKLFQSPQ